MDFNRRPGSGLRHQTRDGLASDTRQQDERSHGADRGIEKPRELSCATNRCEYTTDARFEFARARRGHREKRRRDGRTIARGGGHFKKERGVVIRRRAA